jgi:hypothetical protein
MNLDEILYGGGAIQGHLYSILLNSVASFKMISEVGENNPLITFKLIGGFG